MIITLDASPPARTLLERKYFSLSDYLACAESGGDTFLSFFLLFFSSEENVGKETFALQEKDPN